MVKRKNRKDPAVINRDITDDKGIEADNAQEIRPRNTTIEFPKSASTPVKSLRFDQLYDIGLDDIISRIHHKIQDLVDGHVNSRGTSLSLATIRSYYDATKAFGRFCQAEAQFRGANLKFSDIDATFIKQYLNYLSELGFGRDYYSNTKQVLTRCGVSKSIFPKNPYPNSNRKMKGEKRLSKSERSQVARAVRMDWVAIKQSSGALNSQQLVSCVIGIALRTGMNPTPLVELRIDCLLPHPLKEDRMVIVSYKRRGKKINVTPVKKRLDDATFKTALPDVIEIIKLVKERNADLRSGSAYPDKLFVASAAVSTGSVRQGEAIAMSTDVLRDTHGIPRFVKRHNLQDDSGKPLILNTMRLRKTFENRIWELSGGDPFMTAVAGNHSVKVSDTHYLEVPEDANERLQFIGEARVNDMLATGTEKTPLAHCKDPLNGHRAPKNGKYCDAFLACFRCKSCVVTGDDLYKLFSLYWMLVRERNSMSTRAWSKHFRHILHTIDNNISPQFDEEKVQSVREYAKNSPHPYWQTLDQLGGINNIY
ncbi:MAG: hypothetical protein CL693_09835 [Cellvibrionaceae bacterium]|nr:hypothetical protein [Cellvibrionaceae bacterium]